MEKPRYIHLLVSQPFEDMTATKVVGDDVDEIAVAMMYDLEQNGFTFDGADVWFGIKYYRYSRTVKFGPSYRTTSVRVGVS